MLLSLVRSQEPEPVAGAGQDWTGSTTLVTEILTYYVETKIPIFYSAWYANIADVRDL